MKDNTMTSGLSQRVWESKARRYLSASLTSKLKRLKEKQMAKDLQDWLRDGQSGTILYFLTLSLPPLLYSRATLYHSLLSLMVEHIIYITYSNRAI